MSGYYNRFANANTDGSPLFAMDHDKANETAFAGLVSQAWRCEMHPFGRLCPVDYYAVRDGRLSGVLELKSRSHASDRFPTVFLNVRKWLALQMASVGLGVPAVFSVQFADGPRWIRVDEIDARQHAIGGTMRPIKSRSDIEPVILVPVDTMKPLAP